MSRTKGVSRSKRANKSIRADIRDFRLNRAMGKPVVEYNLVTLYKTPTIEKKIVRWESWKRYSELKNLDSRLRAEYGPAMQDVSFPPKKMFGNTDPVFLAKRKDKLSTWLQQLLKVRNIADFHKPHISSKSLRDFFEFDEHCKGGGAGSAEAALEKKKQAERKSRSSPRSSRSQRVARRTRNQKRRGSKHIARTTSGRSSASASYAPAPAPAAAAPAPASAPPPPPPSGGPPPPPPSSGPPPPAPSRPPPASSSGRGGLLASIRGGKKLKSSKHKTKDRSGVRGAVDQEFDD